MALNKFILDILNGKDSTKRSFETWKDEILAVQQKTHTDQLQYLQSIYQPRHNYEIETTEFLETNKALHKEYMRLKTSASLHNWLSHYTTMPEKNNVTEIYSAFS